MQDNRPIFSLDLYYVIPLSANKIKFIIKIITLQITNYNTTSSVYTRLSVNRDMVKHYEALGLLTTPVYVFALPTHVKASL